MSLFGLVLSPLWVSLVLIGIGAITVVVCLPDSRLYYAGSIDGPQLIGLVVGVAMIIAGVGVFGYSEYTERTAFPYEEPTKRYNAARSLPCVMWTSSRM